MLREIARVWCLLILTILGRFFHSSVRFWSGQSKPYQAFGKTLRLTLVFGQTQTSQVGTVVFELRNGKNMWPCNTVSSLISAKSSCRHRYFTCGLNKKSFIDRSKSYFIVVPLLHISLSWKMHTTQTTPGKSRVFRHKSKKISYNSIKVCKLSNGTS